MFKRFRKVGFVVYVIVIFGAFLYLYQFAARTDADVDYRNDKRHQQRRDSENPIPHRFRVIKKEETSTWQHHDKKLRTKSPLTTDNRTHSPVRETDDLDVVIVAAMCGHEAMEEGLVMLKSAVIFQNSSNLKFIVICDYNRQEELNNRLQHMQTLSNNSFSYQILYPTYVDYGGLDWKQIEGQKPCTNQRLFLPNMLPNISNILYVDTDVIFTNGLSDIWRQAVHPMNSSHLAAMIYEAESPKKSSYAREMNNVIPFYKTLGLNAGVMFMNLAKMRQLNWINEMVKIYKKYKFKTRLNDQHIINIFFHYHPDMLYLLPCSYNYRDYHCDEPGLCTDSETAGISILHGWINTFQYRPSTMHLIYNLFAKFEIGTDPYVNLVLPLKKDLDNRGRDICGDMISAPLLKNSMRLFGT